MNKKGFTLVELIVVITILAILGTISFISLQSYSVEARDSKRLTDARNLVGKVTMEQVKGVSFSSLIEKNTTKDVIIDNTGAISNIGKTNFSNILEREENFKDPLINIDYPIAYAEGGIAENTYKFVQVATVKEKDKKAMLLGSYYKMNPETDSPSLFVNEKNEWVVEGGSVLPYDPVDKKPDINKLNCASFQGGNGDTSNITTYIEQCEGKTAGEVFSLMGSRYSDSQGTNCDQDDIIICNGTSGSGYILSACDIGASASGQQGKRFQWGNNYGFPIDGAVKTSEKRVDTAGYGPGCYYSSDTFIVGDITNADWTTDHNSNLWGGQGDIFARQGPCGNGYHLPSRDEIKGITKDINTATNGNWYGVTLKEAINMPKVGSYLHYKTGIKQGERLEGSPNGSHNRYWMAEQSYDFESQWYYDDYARSIYIQNGSAVIGSYNAGMSYNDYREKAYGFSLRCFKN